MAEVEKLVVLKHGAPNILGRLAWARQKCAATSSGSKIGVFADSKYEKLLATVDKKFPVMDSSIDKATGYSELKSKAKVFFEELEPHYFALVDAYQYKELAGAHLVAAANATTEFILDNNPNVTELFFDVFCDYAKVVSMVQHFEEKKRVLGIYMKLFKYVKQTDEPNYAKVSKWVHDWDQVPHQHMAKEFKSVSDKIGRSLANHLLMFSRARTVAGLRKEGTLNITHKPEDVTKPATDQYHLQLHLVPKLAEWVQWVGLASPHSLHHMSDLAKAVLSDVWMTGVAGDCTIEIHHEIHHVSEKVKDIKEKKISKDTVGTAASNGPKAHRERRVYLRQEMSQLLHLMTDQPGLLGPKFPLVLAALSMAREEVLAHFRHVGTSPGMQRTKVPETETNDRRVSDLIWHIQELRSLVEDNVDSIQDYYLGYLATADAKALSQMCNSEFEGAVGAGVVAICKDLIAQIQSAKQGDRKVDFRVLRLNWLRAEAAMTGSKENMPLSKIKKTVDRFNLAVYHTRIADDLPNLMTEYAGLSELYFLASTAFFNNFSQIVKETPCQPQHVAAYIRLVADFPGIAIDDYELKEIGSTSQKLADKMIHEVVSRVQLLLHEIAKKHVEFDDQVDPQNSLPEILSRLPQNQNKKKQIKLPPKPGSESVFRNRPQLEKTRQYMRNCWQLCSALSEFDNLIIFKMEFCPREYLREKLGERFVKFLRGKVQYVVGEGKQQVKVLQRPSRFLQQVRAYQMVLKSAEYFLDFDIDQMCRGMLLSEFFSPPLTNLPSMNWCDAEESAWKIKGTTAGMIVSWYSKMLRHQFQKPGVVMSELRESFVSKVGSPLVPQEGGCVENFTDPAELRALCELGGAYLATMVEREVLKFIVEKIGQAKASLHTNKAVLEDFAANYKDERKSTETLKKLKDPETFVQIMIAIGNALSFRRLLFHALGEVTSERAPLLFDSCDALFSQYRRNTFMAKELVPSDAMAHACGIDVGGAADQALKKYLAKAVTAQDQPLWDLLPTMFALSFYAPSWKRAEFRPAVGAHENNVGVMAIAAADLLVGLKATTSKSDDEKEIVNMLQHFLEVSSTVLLRVGGGHKYGKEDKLVPVHFASMMIFLDKLVASCPLLTRDALEQVVPYSLLVNDWHQVLEDKGGSFVPVAAASEQAGTALGGKAEDNF